MRYLLALVLFLVVIAVSAALAWWLTPFEFNLTPLIER